MPNWHEMAVDATMDHVQSSRQGLSAGEVRNRLAAYGPNVRAEGKRRSPWRMFVDQFTDVMILVLLGAAVISGLIGEAIDTIASIAIVILNAVIGFIQEYRTERAMEALKAMASAHTTVLREGAIGTMAVTELVARDVVLLEAGVFGPPTSASASRRVYG